MRRSILVAMMLVVAVAGCDRFPDNGLQIAANLPPDSSCEVSADQDTRLLRGLYDLAFRNAAGEPSDYFIAPLLESYLVSNALEFQAEQANIQVDNLDITLLLPDGSKPLLPEGLVNPYRVTTSAVIEANESSGGVSQEVAAAIGIPGSYQPVLQSLFDSGQTSIILDIRAGGTTFGGFSQRSAPFRWPVELCSGCLDNCLSEELEDSCLPGQDIWPYCSVVPPTP